MLGATTIPYYDSNHVATAIHDINDTNTTIPIIQEIHNNKILVTIFTLTYNRAYSIPSLYNSLKGQTNKDFECLIVDDGTTEDTEDIVKEWIQETKFPIRYFKQENGGKHRAINRGLKEARGELFFIVDSDDYLTTDAIETIHYRYAPIKNQESFCGVCLLCIDKELNKVGSPMPKDLVDCSCLDFRYRYCVSGKLHVLR